MTNDETIDVDTRKRVTWIIYSRFAVSVLAFLFLIGSVSTIIPLLPGIQVHYFCDTVSDKDSACAARASLAHSLSQSLYFAGIFAFSPTYGSASDHRGRKMFFVLGVVGRAAPFCCLWVFSDRLLFFYAMTVLGGFAPAADMMFFTMIADLVPKADRMRYFGFGAALFFSAFGVGAGISSHFQPIIGIHGVLDVSAKMCIASIVSIAIILPETLSAHLMQHGSIASQTPGVERARSVFDILRGIDANPPVELVRRKSVMRMLQGVGLGDEGMFRRIAWLGLLSFLPQDGVITVGLFYVKTKLAIDSRALSELGAQMLCVVGLGTVLWSTVGLWFFRCICPSNGKLYLLFMCFDILHLLGYALVWAPWILLANGALSGAAVTLPVILRGLVSESLPPTAQGRGSGVVSSVAALASCIAPVIFGTLFFCGTKIGLPGLPFIVGIALLVASCHLSSRWLAIPEVVVDDVDSCMTQALVQ